MRSRVLAAATVGACLLAGSTSAQVAQSGGTSLGTRFSPPPTRPEAVSPPSPVTPIAPAPPRSRGRDLFRAGPDTYAPQFDRPNQSLFFPYYLFPGYPTFSGALPDRMLVLVTPAASPAPERLAAPVAPAAPPAAPVPMPGVRKTLYVIPRCYAGDTPPRPEQLPPGCRLDNLRRVEPH